MTSGREADLERASTIACSLPPPPTTSAMPMLRIVSQVARRTKTFPRQYTGGFELLPPPPLRSVSRGDPQFPRRAHFEVN